MLTPVIELALLIEVGTRIGLLATIGLVLLTAFTGVSLLRRQGLATLTRGAARLGSGELPTTELAEGVLLAIAGALLVTPGFITDGVGFALLWPAFRAGIAERLLRRVSIHARPPQPGRTFESSATDADGR